MPLVKASFQLDSPSSKATNKVAAFAAVSKSRVVAVIVVLLRG
jgi:hypothetical protein